MPLPSRVDLSPPNIGDDERRLVQTVLQTDDIAYGPTVRDFETAVAQRLRRRHAIAVSSGTAALHLALLATGVGASDEVLMPTMTFIAPANAIRYIGAVPVVFDAEATHRQMDLERLALWLADHCVWTPSGTLNHRTRRRIGAVLAVDLLGHPTDLQRLREVVAPYGIPVIDDAAEALGALLRDEPIGAGADIVCLSFNANKIVTTGGGGMLLCDDDTVDEVVRHLAAQAKDGAGYDHTRVGFNYRLPSAAAALGLGQFRRLDEFVDKKRAIAAHYRQHLKNVPGLTLPNEAPWATSTDWLYTVHVGDASGCDVAHVMEALDRRGVASRPLFVPMHRTAAHAGTEAHACTVAEELSRTGLILPSSTKLEEPELHRVTTALRAAIDEVAITETRS